MKGKIRSESERVRNDAAQKRSQINDMARERLKNYASLQPAPVTGSLFYKHSGWQPDL